MVRWILRGEYADGFSFEKYVPYRENGNYNEECIFMNFSKIKKFLKIFKKGIDNLKTPCYNIITVKNTSRAERLISAES